MADHTRYLTIEEVARRFGVNVTTVYRLVQQGKLPAFKVGNQGRYREDRLEEWVAIQQRVGCSREPPRLRCR
jgi:excisionase family DNA binding protein